MCLLFWVIVFIFGFYDFAKNAINNENKLYYPSKNAVAFLKTLPLDKNLLNDYGFGGYLIWKVPERKYFIDGRMPSWRDGKEFVFGDYVKIYDAKPGFDKLLSKYNVTLAMISTQFKDKAVSAKREPKNSKLRNFLEKQSWLSYVLGISLSNNIYTELTKLGWKIIYQDDTAIILKKP